jgi:hypothetical protein
MYAPGLTLEVENFELKPSLGLATFFLNGEAIGMALVQMEWNPASSLSELQLIPLEDCMGTNLFNPLDSPSTSKIYEWTVQLH